MERKSDEIPIEPLIVEQPGLDNQPGAISTPKGEPLKPAPGTTWMPLPPAIPGVPSGLEYLTYLQMVQIYQIKGMFEIITGWETKNKYALRNSNGEQCYYAFEESECCERYLCGPQRGFTMHIVDNFQREVLTIHRPFKLCGHGGLGCICGSQSYCQHECTIESPSMGILGTVRQAPGCVVPNFVVLDVYGQSVFEIGGPAYCNLFYGCRDKKFTISSTFSDTEIGAITKKWGGCCREMLTDADTFFVTFPLDLDVKLKGVLLGATFLIDFISFENYKGNGTGCLGLLAA